MVDTLDSRLFNLEEIFSPWVKTIYNWKNLASGVNTTKTWKKSIFASKNQPYTWKKSTHGSKNHLYLKESLSRSKNHQNLEKKLSSRKKTNHIHGRNLPTGVKNTYTWKNLAPSKIQPYLEDLWRVWEPRFGIPSSMICFRSREKSFCENPVPRGG